MVGKFMMVGCLLYGGYGVWWSGHQIVSECITPMTVVVAPMSVFLLVIGALGVFVELSEWKTAK